MRELLDMWNPDNDLDIENLEEEESEEVDESPGFDFQSDKLEYPDEVRKAQEILAKKQEEEKELEETLSNSEIPEVRGKEVSITLTEDDKLQVVTQVNLIDRAYKNDLKDIDCTSYDEKEVNIFWVPFTNDYVRVLSYALRGTTQEYNPPELKKELSEKYKQSKPLHVDIDKERKKLSLESPDIESYNRIMRNLGAMPGRGHWTLDSSQIMLLNKVIESNDLPYYEPVISEEVKFLTEEPLPDYDGYIRSMDKIDVGVLNYVKANPKQMDSKKKTIEERFHNFGLNSLSDMVFNTPRRYIDKSNPLGSIDGMMVKEEATIIGKIVGLRWIQDGSTPVFAVDTGESKIDCTFWKQRWLTNKFRIGEEVLVNGKVNYFRGVTSLNGSSIEYLEEGVSIPIIPIYKQSGVKGINSDMLMKSVYELFERAGEVKKPEYLPDYGELDYGDVHKSLHFPERIDDLEEAKNILAFYELVNMQLLIAESKKDEKNAGKGIVLDILDGSPNYQAKAAKSLPFSLTGDQIEAVKTLNQAVSTNKPGSSILIADVGAGKTVIAQMMMLKAKSAGYQSALIAPTTVLANQLYKSTVNLIEGAGLSDEIKVALLSKDVSAKEMRENLKGIADGTVDIIVGTHAAFGKNTKYANLGFVCYDELQKFGAEQREKLLYQREDGRIPYCLSQSATPVPRSIAQTIYGDSEVIILKDKPVGRKEIVTEWIDMNPNEVIRSPLLPMWEDLIDEIDKGNQVFIVTPRVNDTSASEVASVKETFKILSTTIFKSYNVGMVHGSMDANDVAETMEKFKDKEYDVLIGSIVVEVGVDIPGATRVVILSADRMGASSLHQIRGRVGRNDMQSMCYLVSEGYNQNSAARLQALVDYSDGFDIAEYDLHARGEGSLTGTNQAGDNGMQFANVIKDYELIPLAVEAANEIMDGPHREEALKEARISFYGEE